LEQRNIPEAAIFFHFVKRIYKHNIHNELERY